MQVFPLNLGLLEDHNIGLEYLEHALQDQYDVSKIRKGGCNMVACLEGLFVTPWLVAKWIPVDWGVSLNPAKHMREGRKVVR